jgi:hypothetical protein
MTDWETINSIVHGAEWAAAGAAAAVCGYFGLLYGLQAPNVLSPFNKTINSQKDLEKAVFERAPKAGLNPSDIHAKYVHLGDTFADNKKEGHKEEGYVLSFGDDSCCTKGQVNHELCHMANGDCDRKNERDLYYFFVSEPRAVLYQVFGLKVGWKK